MATLAKRFARRLKEFLLRSTAVFGVLLIALLGASGCSTSHQPIPSKTVEVADLKATVIPEPNPPQTGDNVLDVNLADSSGNPVPNANITATAVTTLTGNTGATESARSAGNGAYRIPIHTPVSELYIVTMTVQRTGKKDVVMKYGIKPQ
jgi:hypothetical protein